jgi:hypothetical protein
MIIEYVTLLLGILYCYECGADVVTEDLYRSKTIYCNAKCGSIHDKALWLTSVPTATANFYQQLSKHTNTVPQ